MYSAWLAPIRDQIPLDLDAVGHAALSQAISQEAMRRFGDLLAGISFYQNAPAVRNVDSDVAVVWSKGTTRLLDYAPESSDPIVFVVPSLVNRFEILDLDTDHSFLRYLKAQGFHPLVIDWDRPGTEEQNFTLGDYIMQRLVPAVEFAGQLGGDAPLHVLGYCMGGVLALAMSVLKPECLASLTLMATPWDFAVKGVGGVPAADTPVGEMFLKQAKSAMPCLASIGTLPSEFLQAVFTGFQPLAVLQKFSRFATPPATEKEARRFVLTEDWLNNGIPLSLPVAKECLEEWYEKNMMHRLQWSVADTLVDPRLIKLPTYCLVPLYDKVVPPESAKPLVDLIAGAVLQEPATGHLGLMASDNAPEKVWKPYVSWLKSLLVR